MPYSAKTDLLTGNIPLPSYVDADKYVADAADEIDSYIGFIYKTPVDVTEQGPTSRPARLLLKRLNNFLASGRLMMAAAAAQEDTEQHAYARRLVGEALDSLKMIAEGKISLDGAEPAPASSDAKQNVPVILNKDVESNVDAFYDRITNPDNNWVYSGPFPRVI